MRLRPTMCRLAAATLTIAATVGPAKAQWEALEGLPGYFPLDELPILAPDDVSIEVNLTTPMLELVAAFAGEEEPELAELVKGLQAVRVRSGEPGEGDLDAVRSRLGEAGRWLDERGWTPMVRVREEGEEVLIYSRLDDAGGVEGITVLAMEEGEVTVVNLIGSLDPARLGRILSGLDLPLGDVGLRGGEGSADEEEDR